MPTPFPWRLAAMLGALVALVLFTGLAVRSCDRHRSQAAQARVDRGQTEALSNSAADAVDTVGNAAAREGASEDLTRSNEQEIRNAEGSNAAVAPTARDAGLRALCRREAYRDNEQCRVLKPRP